MSALFEEEDSVKGRRRPALLKTFDLRKQSSEIVGLDTYLA